MSQSESPAAASLRALFGRLVTRRVENWTGSDDPRPEAHIEPEAGMPEANIVTSKHAVGPGHALVLDLDHPSWLVRSSTPGHFHLYVDVPGGIPMEKYLRLLNMLADCGVIEPGFAAASGLRGYSSARLPWIRKGQD